MPIELLDPILEDLLKLGRPGARAAALARHVHHANTGPQLTIGGIAPDSPADRAGLRIGNVILAWPDTSPRAWPTSGAGSGGSGLRASRCRSSISRKGSISDVVLRSADRNDYLKKPHLH